MNWMQVEAYLEHDDRCVLPLGCTEQHAYLSLATDTILATKVAGDAAEAAGVPVFPALTFGVASHFAAFPGTVSVRQTTFAAILHDLLDSLYAGGFRRVLIVNGHAGNSPAQHTLPAWSRAHAGAQVRWHDWWAAPHTLAVVKSIHPVATHASWVENFPWTRLHGVESPEDEKTPIDWEALRSESPAAIRAAVGDGNFGGPYQVEGRHMARLWQVAVQETREVLEKGWKAAGQA